MRTMCSREIFTKKCRQEQIFDSDLKEAWHYNHVTFTPIAKNFMLYCRLIHMLSMLYVRLTIKVKVGIPESFKVGWYPPKKTGSSHLNQWLKLTLKANHALSNSAQGTTDLIPVRLLPSPHPGQCCSVLVRNDPTELQYCFFIKGRGGGSISSCQCFQKLHLET